MAVNNLDQPGLERSELATRKLLMQVQDIFDRFLNNWAEYRLPGVYVGK